MSESIRQNNLFAAEDWKVVYNAFRNVSLQAYDYNTIYNALIDYLRTNNPDEFNDYVQHSEMLAHINMLAYLGQSYAFRIDLNARENFFDTAERRESVLKLAQGLSYKPKRNRTANGLCKIVSVQTTEPLLDSQGNNISNTEISWEQINNSSWYENFIKVLNRAFLSTNRFGEPVKSGSVNNIDTQVYSINNLSVNNSDIVYNFSSSVNGENMSFEVVSADIDENVIKERSPRPESSINILYRNDQLGSSSPDTGFFVYFKEGELNFANLEYNTPVPDREELIDVANINETDVWLQELDTDTGNVTTEWTPISSLVGQNIIYNDVYLDRRKVYSVNTESGNRVRLKFSDGNFGEVPIGSFRVMYRTSRNQSFIIRPNDIQKRTINIRYVGKDNQNYILTLKFSLQYTIDNAEAEETTNEIKRNAPLVHYTQDRMINGEDYNVFPLTQSNLVRKVKAVNRTHAGHSRYIDITDPTGAHSNTTVVGDDAYMYKDYGLNSDGFKIESNTNYASLVRTRIEPLLNSYGIDNYYFHDIRSVILSEQIDNLGGYGSDYLSYDNGRYVWKTLPMNMYATTGYIYDTQASQNVEIGVESPDNKLKLLRENSKVLFKNNNGQSKWITIRGLEEGGIVNLQVDTTGTVELSNDVDDGWYIKEVIPGIRKSLNTDEKIAVQTEIENNRSFGLRYDFINDSWLIIAQENIVNTDNDTFDLNAPALPNAPDNRWVLKATFINEQGEKRYNIITRQLRYIFGSDKQVRFFFKNNDKVIDYETGKFVQDYIKILSSNSDRKDIKEQTTTARAVVGHMYTSATHSSTTEYDITSSIPYNANIGDVKLLTVDKKIINNWEITFDNNRTILSINDSLIPNDTVTAFKITDVIEVYDLEGGNDTLTQSYNFSVVDSFIQNDGIVDYSKVLIEPQDSDDDEIQDYPLAFEDIVNLNEYVFFKTYSDIDNIIYNRVDSNVLLLNDNTTRINEGVVYYCSSDITINDNYGNPINYVAGNFYEGDDVDGSGVRPNSATLLVNDSDNDGNTYSAFIGRTFTKDDPFFFQWKHYAGGKDRIDPSISNIIDTYVLTRSYDNAVRTWLNNRESVETFPSLPTSNEIKSNLQMIENNKSTSDQIIYIPASYKLLFGVSALPEYRAKFKIVKTTGSYLTDNEIKSQVIEAVNEFFNIDNWDFGSGFYFTELSTYVHTKLTGNIASVVIVPEDENSRFGELFEIRSEPNELFLSTATVDNIEIVRTYTDANLRK